MDFRKIQTLAGPNVWAGVQSLEVWVDLRDHVRLAASQRTAVLRQLTAWLPGLQDRWPRITDPGPASDLLSNGRFLAQLLAQAALELQGLAGATVEFAEAGETHEQGVFRAAVQYEEASLGLACLEAARALCVRALRGEASDVAAEVAKLRSLADDVLLGPSTRAIVQAALARGIPVRRLNTNSLVQLGHGVHLRRIQAAESDRTGAIAEAIAQDKELTRTLLQEAGVPVPEGRPVSDAEDAWEAASEIGAPVVVKPQFGNQGRGVATNLSTREQVVAAFAAAEQEGSSILVEKYVPGADYRLLVVGGRMVAAARREPARVIGDGMHAVAQLVQIVNADPRRGEGHANVLSRIRLDPIALAVLAEQGMTPDSIPEAGQTVYIRRNGNLSTGGTATDVTAEVHADVAARAVDAARVIGLDIAGIDVVTSEIGRPLEETGGVIVEVNAGPGLRMHLQPAAGQPRPVGEAIVDQMFPHGLTGRIPVVGVTGTNGKTTTTRLIAAMFQRAGQRTGMACTDGIFIDGRRIDRGDCSGPRSARAVLSNPLVEAAVCETARGGILRAGLAFDRCDVAVVTNIADGDHLGLGGVETVEELAAVKQTLVRAVAPDGAAVLKASDPWAAGMAAHCPGRVVYFDRQADHPVILRHRAARGRTVFVHEGYVVLAEGAAQRRLIALDQVPLTYGGRAACLVEDVLAAAAAAWQLGLPPEAIRAVLQTFVNNVHNLPGRFNLLEVRGATVLVDYGHNPSSLAAVIESLDAFPHERRLAVYSAAGDRRDCDLVRQGRLLGDAFDQVVLYEDHYTRGRPDGQIMSLFQRGLSGGSRVREAHEVRGAVKSMEFALDLVRAGDLLLIQADAIDETVEFLDRWLRLQPARPAAAPADSREAVLEHAGVR